SVTIGRNDIETLNISLVPVRASLRVQVVDAATGIPIEGAMISFATSDELPGADYKLLVPLKRSRAYGAIRPRVADLRPTDAWKQDELHFFVFRLRAANGTATPE